MTETTVAILSDAGLDISALNTGELDVFSPIDGIKIASVKTDTHKTTAKKIDQSVAAFTKWRSIPAPRRGELIRLYGEKLRHNKDALAKLVTLECGKIYQEGLGEVQEMIDICDFAVGLSRQLYGLTIASERPQHKMREIWHPLGPVGIISAFNFPVAVWAWNAALAIVCGDSIIWKPSEKTPLTALACQKLFEETCKDFGPEAPKYLSQVLIGGRDIGEALVDSKHIPLISATGSTAMGRIVGERVAARFGKSLLELGGNNAIIVAPSADLDLAFQGILFGAVGTAGQRCTTTRRLFVHESVYSALVPRLKKAYGKLAIGSPLDPKTLIGPLIDKQSYDSMKKALKKTKGKITGGERVLEKQYPKAYYVSPALVEMDSGNIMEETFAPILYIFKYKNIDEAIALQNAVPQGLSSSIFTNDIREAELFTSEIGSDCGIANVNIGTSGAEIGGAFGGEKETGGGRESGSDSWRAYMRRMTSTINYSRDLPLAQGIQFKTES